MAWGILITMVTVFAMLGMTMFEATHVDLDPARSGGLAAHTMPAAADRDRTAVARDRVDDLFRRRRHDDFVDGDGVELGDVVDDGRRRSGSSRCPRDEASKDSGRERDGNRAPPPGQ